MGGTHTHTSTNGTLFATNGTHISINGTHISTNGTHITTNGMHGSCLQQRVRMSLVVYQACFFFFLEKGVGLEKGWQACSHGVWGGGKIAVVLVLLKHYLYFDRKAQHYSQERIWTRRSERKTAWH